MTEPNSSSPPNERLQFALAIVLVLVILSTCVAVPVVVASQFHPGWGVLAAIFAMVAWTYLGPPPSPGLLNGIVALLGMLLIAGIMVGLLVRVVVLLFS